MYIVQVTLGTITYELEGVWISIYLLEYLQSGGSS